MHRDGADLDDLACGDREAAATLVAIDGVFQILAFALLGNFSLGVLPGWLGLQQSSLDVSVWGIASRPLRPRGEHPMTRTGSVPEHLPQVVFVCRANGGRSVMSRLLTEHYADGRVVALSAGTEPGEEIHPEVARALADLGLDPSRETPRRVSTEMVAASDLAITMGCGDNCPWSPHTEFRDWPLEDPRGRDDATVHRILADVDARVRALLVELVPDLRLPPSLVGGA